MVTIKNNAWDRPLEIVSNHRGWYAGLDDRKGKDSFTSKNL